MLVNNPHWDQLDSRSLLLKAGLEFGCQFLKTILSRLWYFLLPNVLHLSFHSTRMSSP